MALTRTITDNEIETEHQALWNIAIQEHGDKFAVPGDVAQSISDRTRGLYILKGWDGKGSAARLLGSYSVNERTIISLVQEYCGEDIDEIVIAPKEKRVDKYDKLVSWAKQNIFVQKTTEELVEIGGFSYQTTLKFVQDSPYFRKVKKGLWEVRDPASDRSLDKS
jgi:hypothetical protein